MRMTDGACNKIVKKAIPIGSWPEAGPQRGSRQLLTHWVLRGEARKGARTPYSTVLARSLAKGRERPIAPFPFSFSFPFPFRLVVVVVVVVVVVESS
jgi:hypothetical protein